MQLKQIGLTALVTLLTGISTPVSALTAKGYTPEVRQTNSTLLELAANQQTPTPSDEFKQWFDKANSLLEKGNYAEALKAYEQAIRINPNSAGAWGGRGEALYELKQYSEAIASYQRAVNLDPKLTAAWVGLGNALDDAGNSEKALTAYEQALRLSPNSPTIWYNQGITLARLKQYEQAVAS